MSDLTVVILTKNESRNIEKCLCGVPSGIRIVLVDSGSTDNTVELAKLRGCDVYHSPWLGFAGQRNFAIKNCNIKQGWILFVDADEIYESEFFEWFGLAEKELNSTDVLMVPSYLVFKGKRLRYAPGYPIYHPRLVRSGCEVFINGHAGHSETVASSARIKYGKIHYDHFFYEGNIFEWMSKHINLASMEIKKKGSDIGVISSRGRISLIFGSSIARAPLRFIYHYIIRGGILDGRPGLEYSLMYSWYEMTKYVMLNCRITK